MTSLQYRCIRMRTALTSTRTTVFNRAEKRTLSKANKTRGRSLTTRLNFSSRPKVSALRDRGEFKGISQVIFHQLIIIAEQGREMI